MRGRAPLWFAPVLLAGTVALGQERPALVPAAKLKPLETALRLLAAKGCAAEVAELLDVCEALGMPGKALAALRKQYAVVRGAPSAAPDAAKALADAATTLAAGLPDLAPDVRAALAGLLLRVDDACVPAREALGHRREGDRWIAPEGDALGKRRAAIADAVRAARVHAPDLGCVEERHRVFDAVYDRPAMLASAGGLRVYSALPREATVRAVGDALRASALSAWLRGEPLARDAGLQGTWLLLDGSDAFLRWIADARMHEGLSQAEAEAAAQFQVCSDRRGFRVGYALDVPGATDVLASEFLTVVPPYLMAQPAVVVGHGNWVCLALWDRPLMQYAWQERESGHTRASGRDPEREARWKFAGAGLTGRRGWLAHLAERREDPAFARALQDEVGKIGGADLLKAIGVAEFLHERGPLDPLLAATTTAPDARHELRVAAFEAAVGEALPEFEARWRRWIAPPRAGLAQRAAAGPSDPAGTAGPFAAAISRARERAYATPDLKALAALRDEPTLLRGAAAHADYLQRNPEAAGRWPDQATEVAGAPGHTPEGAWTAARALICLDAGGADAAVERWLGAFPHRIAILDPGLRAIGAATAGRVTVCDAGSLVAVPEVAYRIRWPMDGQKGVPRVHADCAPLPVPGATADALGYPVTFQAFGGTGVGRAIAGQLTLHEGKPDGPAVACFEATPVRPLRPEVAPPNAWAAIPRAPLKPKTRYVAVMRLTGAAEETIAWEFETGG